LSYKYLHVCEILINDNLEQNQASNLDHVLPVIGANVMIKKIFSPKILAKRFLLKLQLIMQKTYIIIQQCFLENQQKIFNAN
jgi:hypothetical protein